MRSVKIIDAFKAEFNTHDKTVAEQIVISQLGQVDLGQAQAR